MEKTFLLYLSVHWGDFIEQIKKICHIHFKARANVKAVLTSLNMALLAISRSRFKQS